MPILKLIGRLSFGFLSVALAVVLSTPAQAFSLQVPKAVKDSFRSLLAQEGQIIQQPQQPGTLGQFQPQPMQRASQRINRPVPVPNWFQRPIPKRPQPGRTKPRD